MQLIDRHFFYRNLSVVNFFDLNNGNRAKINRIRIKYFHCA